MGSGAAAGYAKLRRLATRGVIDLTPDPARVKATSTKAEPAMAGR
jgi:hypothetical protein